jgi:hypothetical protein
MFGNGHSGEFPERARANAAAPLRRRRPRSSRLGPGRITAPAAQPLGCAGRVASGIQVRPLGNGPNSIANELSASFFA